MIIEYISFTNYDWTYGTYKFVGSEEDYRKISDRVTKHCQDKEEGKTSLTDEEVVAEIVGEFGHSLRRIVVTELDFGT